MNDLGNLSDPLKFHEPVSIDGMNSNDLVSMLRSMILIRKTEQKLAEARRDGLIGGPVHLGAGQEAIAVGISKNLVSTDRVFGAHRSHSHLLALNPNFYRLFAEVLGKETGFSKGMGGSMHLYDQPSGFYGSVPIVAGTAPLAVGAAMAAKMQGTSDIGVAYIGDGAVEEGVIHESLNFASINNIPVLFVVENNLFASHMNIALRQSSNFTSRYAEANNIEHCLLDGNDVVDIQKTSESLISEIRNGGGPKFIELVTYRWYGHVDWRDDVDVGVERSTEDIANWKKRDPILRLSSSLIEHGLWTVEDERSFINELDKKINNAWDSATNDPYPDLEATLDYVYFNDKGTKQ
ncbi:thiamine pyrophosphate-dependent dehydrogenase E1 component subunit alpha [Gammaproteobacteria bacterium]|nr:thiamine pyrophosphate-dependent dehydrogenase E1 component subunit alpha [Gammaproteobacteria bacterium]